MNVSEEQQDVIMWVAKQYDYRLDGVPTNEFWKKYALRCMELDIHPQTSRSLVITVRRIFDLPRTENNKYVGGIREELRGEGEPWTPLNLE